MSAAVDPPILLKGCILICLVVFKTLFLTPGIVAHQVPLSMGFPRQEYWSGLPFPSPAFYMSVP